MKPLTGIRVLDLGRYVAGPYCGMLLGDYGAEVIKIENPGGDEVRSALPMYQGEGLFFLAFNRNKKSVTINFRKPQGRELFSELVKTADVIVENFRPGTLESMGFSYDELCKLKKDLILVSVSGYGQNGPYSKRPALDMIAQAIGGLMSVIGFPDGPPTKIGPFSVDVVAGLYGFAGCLLALLQRQLTGQGQWVDVGLMDCAVALLETYPAEYLLLGEEPTRTGNRRKWTAPANLYQAKDGYVYIIAGANVMWSGLCELLGRPELAKDERFNSRQKRLEHAEFIDQLVAEWVKEKTVQEVVEKCSAGRVPCGPVQTVADICRDPQVAAREMILEAFDPERGKLFMPGMPIKLSGAKGEVKLFPPKLGEHNEEIFGKELHYDLNELRKNGVIS